MSETQQLKAEKLSISQTHSLSEISRQKLAPLEDAAYPFLSFDFLSALEQSGAVAENTGWQPRHVVVYQGEQLVAFMPLYMKMHSQGEYVFDQAWAAAYQRNGLAYYPKWLTAIPFTPCGGKRILMSSVLDHRLVYQTISEFLIAKSDEAGVSSWHTLFPLEDEMFFLRASGLMIREGVQFQWFNRDYRDFDDYLETFSARNRKKIKRERRKSRDQGIELVRINGSDITEHQWQIFFRFYQATYFKRGMAPYLNLKFFLQLAESIPSKLLLVLAIKNNKMVAAALSVVGSDTLYGRYWGCDEEYSGLHFEACYYQGLDYCLENKLNRFDSGAQGEHKIRRGFEPVTTYSAHWLKDDAFVKPIDAFIRQEKLYLQHYRQAAGNELPFKAGAIKPC